MSSNVPGNTSPDSSSLDNHFLLLFFFLDLLTKQGLNNDKTSSLVFSGVKEVTPPPPSPRSASCNSQEDVELESDTTKKDNESVMIRTSESVSRPTFWIPVDGSSAENNEPTRDPTVGE